MMPQLAYACGSEVHLLWQDDGQEVWSVTLPSKGAEEAEGEATISSLRWLGPRSLLAAGAITLEVGCLYWAVDPLRHCVRVEGVCFSTCLVHEPMCES